MTTTINTTAARKLIASLTRCEVSSKLAADCRRVMRGERYALAAAVKSGDADRISAAAAEASRVAEMWGVTL